MTRGQVTALAAVLTATHVGAFALGCVRGGTQAYVECAALLRRVVDQTDRNATQLEHLQAYAAESQRQLGELLAPAALPDAGP